MCCDRVSLWTLQPWRSHLRLSVLKALRASSASCAPVGLLLCDVHILGVVSFFLGLCKVHYLFWTLSLFHGFAELGIEYCPPSQYLLPVLETDSGKQNSDCLDGMEEAWKVEFVTHREHKTTPESINSALFCSSLLVWFSYCCFVCFRINSVTTRRERWVSFSVVSCDLGL